METLEVMTPAENIAQLQAILDATDEPMRSAVKSAIHYQFGAVPVVKVMACRESQRLAELRCGVRSRLNVLRTHDN